MIVVAIDTGGTKIAGAAVDEEGNILSRVRYSNTGRSGAFMLDTYEKIVNEFRKEFVLSAIGIGAGGRIDPVDGKVIYSTDIYSDYIGLRIGTIMSERCGLPVAVDNDCRVAIYGERWKGAAQGYDSIFGIIIGTGVGGGYIHDGKTVYGSGFGAGEVGHQILHPNGKLCKCGQKGCVEQYVSGSALWEAYNDNVGLTKISSGYEFFRELDNGDSMARDVLNAFADNLAMCAVSISNLFSPKAILLGGGIIDTADLWWEHFEKSYTTIGNVHSKKTAFIKAAAGNDAALLGAAWMAHRVLEKA